MAYVSTTAWVAKLFVSERTRQKIATKHRLDVYEIGREVLCVEGLRGKWDEHPERGLRLLVKVRIRDLSMLVVLYPRGKDEWDLGSAYPIRT